MRAIAEPFYDGSPLLYGPLVGLIVFVCLFALVVARLWRSGAAAFADNAAMALRDDVAPLPDCTSKEPS
jgi:hypothetical protein